MNNIFKIGAIGLGTFFGFKYFNAISKAKNLKFAFSKITINAINSNAFQIGIWLKVSSTNNGNLTLSKSRLKAYLNGTLCGVAVLPYDQIISGQHTTDVYLVCDLYYKDTFKEWWNLLLKASTTATLTIAGGLVVAGTYIPIPALNIKEFSLKDTIQEIKNSNVGMISPYEVYWIYIFPIEGNIKREDFNKILKAIFPYRGKGKSNLGNFKKWWWTYVGVNERLNTRLEDLKKLSLSKNYRVIYTTDKQYGLYHLNFVNTGDTKGLFTNKQIENSFII